MLHNTSDFATYQKYNFNKATPATCDALTIAVENFWTRGNLQLQITTADLNGVYHSQDFFEIKFDKEVNWETIYYPFKDPLVHPDAIQDMGDNTWRLFFADHFTGWENSVIETRKSCTVKFIPIF